MFLNKPELKEDLGKGIHRQGRSELRTHCRGRGDVTAYHIEVETTKEGMLIYHG